MKGGTCRKERGSETESCCCHRCSGTREEPWRQGSSCFNGLPPCKHGSLSFSCHYLPGLGDRAVPVTLLESSFTGLRICLFCLSHSWLEQFKREIVLWMHQDHMEQFPYSYSISGTTPAIVSRQLHIRRCLMCFSSF